MRVQVILFAAARQAVGSPVVSVDLAQNATVGNLREQLTREFPALVPWKSHVLIAVDQQFAGDAVTLAAHQEIACFPPVSGG